MSCVRSFLKLVKEQKKSCMEEFVEYFASVGYHDETTFEILVENGYSIEDIDSCSVEDLIDSFSDVAELSSKLDDLKSALERKKSAPAGPCEAVKLYLSEIGYSCFEANFSEIQFLEEFLLLNKQQLSRYNIPESASVIIEEKNRTQRLCSQHKIPTLIFAKLQLKGARHYFSVLQNNVRLSAPELQALRAQHLESFGVEKADFSRVLEAIEAMKNELESERPLFEESIPRLRKIILPLQQLQNRAKQTLSLVSHALSRFPNEILCNQELHKKLQAAAGLCEERSGIRICITGSMKAGKSSLMNELLKDESFKDVLPTSDNRCTARPTIIRYGEKFQFHVGLEPTSVSSSIEECKKAISLNENDRKKRELVEQPVVIYLPSPLLSIGVELIDLPGKNEHEDIDKIVDKFLQNVDIIIYLFDPSNEWKKQDEQMIVKLQNSDPSLPLMVVASKIDTYESNPKDSSHDGTTIDDALNTLYMNIKNCHIGMKNQETCTHYKQSKFFKQVSINYKYNEVRKQFMKQVEQFIMQRVDPLRESITLVFTNLLRTLLCLLNHLFDDDTKKVEELEAASEEIFRRFLAKIDHVFENQFLHQLSETKKNSKDSILEYLNGLEYENTEGQSAKDLREVVKSELESKFVNVIQPLCSSTEAYLSDCFREICKIVLDDVETNDQVRKQIIRRFEELTKLFQVSEPQIAKGSWKFTSLFGFKIKDFLQPTSTKEVIATQLYSKFHPEDITKQFKKERTKMVSSLKHFINHTIQQERILIDSWKSTMKSMSQENKDLCEKILLNEWIFFYEASSQISSSDIYADMEEKRVVATSNFSTTTYGILNDKPLIVRTIDSGAVSYMEYFRELFMLEYFNSLDLNVVKILGIIHEKNDVMHPQGGPLHTNQKLTIITPYYSNSDLLEKMEKLSNLQKLFITFTILLAVQEFHSRGLSHKWIHPVFILLDDNFIPYFAKFGVTASKLVNASTQFDDPDTLDPTNPDIDHFMSDVYCLGQIVKLVVENWNMVELVYSPSLAKSYSLDKCKTDLMELAEKAIKKSIPLSKLIEEYTAILVTYCEAFQSLLTEGVKNIFGTRITQLLQTNRFSHAKSVQLIKSLEIVTSYAIRFLLSHEPIAKDKYENYSKALKEVLLSPILNFNNEKLPLDSIKIICRTMTGVTLKSLNLSNCKVTKEGCKLISEAMIITTGLMHLNLSGNDFGDDGCECLCDGLKINKSITELELQKVGMKTDGWKALGDVMDVNTTLVSMNLSYNVLEDSGCNPFSLHLKQSIMKRLVLNKCNITDKVCRILCLALFHNKTLYDLSLSDNQFSHEGAKMISLLLGQNSTITYLDVTKNFIGRDGIAFISQAIKDKNCSLKHVLLPTADGVSCSLISDAVAINTSIDLLDLCINSFKIEDLSRLLEPITSSIRTLYLTGNHNGDEVCMLLEPALAASKTLYHLKLSFTDISDKGMKHLCKALELNEKLHTLDISNNSIGEVGCDYLADVLKWNTTLVSLDISGNAINDKGCKFICEALKENNVLLFLAMNNNNIDDGALFVEKLLSRNTNLQVLALENNHISETTGTFLAMGLASNNRLEKLFLNHNNLRTRGCEAILACILNHNSTIQVLDISHNNGKISNVMTITEIFNSGRPKSIDVEGNIDSAPISIRQKSLKAQHSNLLCGFGSCVHHTRQQIL